MRKPYTIKAPIFSTTSGGIRVVYGLYAWLLVKGEVVLLNQKLDEPSVAIYPEIYWGNDLGGTTVVRYVLNRLGVMGKGTPGTSSFKPGPLAYPPTDKIYVFSKIFDTFGVDDRHVMFLPIINTKVFNRKETLRNKTCFLVGKGEDQHQHPSDSIELNRKVAADQENLALLLNECHTLYCYDKMSAMMECARLCGCAVKYYGGYSDTELSLYEPGMNGISTTEEERPFDAKEFFAHYLDMKQIFSNKLDYFIEATQTS